MEPIQFKKLSDNAIIPKRGTEYSAGFDLYASKDVEIVGGDGNFLIHTDVAVQLPKNCYGRIAIRSGLAINQHLSVSAGVIDLDYAGPLGVVVFCTKNAHSYTIEAGERFAQLIPEVVHYGDGLEVSQFKQRLAGHVGYGSTGEK